MTRILFYIEKFAFKGAIGGAERALINLVNNMSHTKYDITVCTMYPEKEAEQLAPHVQYKTLFSKKTKLNQLQYRFEMAFRLLYKLRMKGNYDIECAYLECGSTKAISTSNNKKAKKLAWVHCDFSIAFGADFIKKCSPWYKQFDKVICVSEKAKQSFVEYFGTDVDSIVVHNVVDSEFIIEKASEKLPIDLSKKELTLVCVGRLSNPKNPIRMLNVHKKLIENGIENELWWVGDGEQKNAVALKIQEWGLSNSFKLLGFQQNPYPFIREADLCVCSSNYEGYSTFVTESIVLGKPVVTTDCSGMREILGNSECGIITENSDESFYEGLLRVLSDDSVMKELNRQAQIRSKEFTIKTLIAENEAIFDAIL